MNKSFQHFTYTCHRFVKRLRKVENCLTCRNFFSHQVHHLNYLIYFWSSVLDYAFEPFVSVNASSLTAQWEDSLLRNIWGIWSEPTTSQSCSEYFLASISQSILHSKQVGGKTRTSGNEFHAFITLAAKQFVRHAHGAVCFINFLL